ncbi:dienelactone hydrolase family protein [Stackebrandtia nassauensis]|uniref:Dienelactone hydrolase n=1 Tax=Stackebrandtia nassauensis (strain DSM 44728 / CIP 108903 / NRRL B-16338 / NBRC 102104 / LLR-40K-21) TaxID=446470 RepID=D3Q632_STANL|nr:dienelactone hydrolase family protein [Stackebrandtia nassauensis]ADD42207.1 dienelactone hydrolase [Stackebrandtia nassauensis DSM 44728]
MCHDTDSAPPKLSESGSVASEELLELTSADGTSFTVFHTEPGQPLGRSLVVFPDRRGVHQYYLELARRFAEAGFSVAVLDYYGRTAGPGPRGDDFDWAPNFRQLVPDNVSADAAAVVEFLRRRHPDDDVYSVGFCLGGGHSWRLSSVVAGLNGCVGFYGLPSLAAERVTEISAPLLLLLAGDDVATTAEQFDDFRRQLDEAGKPYEHKVYEGAPHSFFDGGNPEWSEISADAWRRVLDFTDRYASTVA